MGENNTIMTDRHAVGRITYGNADGTAKHGNYGDWFQTFAVEYILNQLNINSLVDINVEKLADYKGPKTLVVMNAWFEPGFKKDIFPISEDIEPMYFGTHRFSSDNLQKEQFDGMLVGCRDEESYKNFKKMGAHAFISGCTTICIPKRIDEPQNPAIFLVDVPAEIEKYIPNNVKSGCEIIKISQEKSNISNFEREARELLDMYKDRAKMVITSRLHCAGPCLGMGIPVILYRKYYDERYSWIDKFLPLYTFKDVDKIEWNVEPIDMSEPKKLILEYFRAYLVDNDKDRCVEYAKKLTNYYLNRNKKKNIRIRC